jgi:hypothetical protein
LDDVPGLGLGQLELEVNLLNPRGASIGVFVLQGLIVGDRGDKSRGWEAVVEHGGRLGRCCRKRSSSGRRRSLELGKEQRTALDLPVPVCLQSYFPAKVS